MSRRAGDRLMGQVPGSWGQRLVPALAGDRIGGVTITLGALAGLVWANALPLNYLHSWSARAPWSAAVGLVLSWRGWVNQGLLLVFFAVIGLEIRRELTVGELHSPRRAAVPVLAALGGMTLPALIYATLNPGGVAARAWGVPMATDAAFALGALALVGSPSTRARVFLMTLAVADDIGSIIVLVLFYGTAFHPVWASLDAGCVVAMAALWALRPESWEVATSHPRLRPAFRAARLALGAGAWWAALHAGIEASVLGVAIGAFVPARRAPRSTGVARTGAGAGGGDYSRVVGRSGPHLPVPRGASASKQVGVRRWELRFSAISNAAVLPLFAVANVGVSLSGAHLGSAAPRAVFVAVLVARVVGKPVGITVAALATRRVASGSLAPRLSRISLLGVGSVASIGFTVPLLVIRAALPAGPLAASATLALLAGSIVGAALGAGTLKAARGRMPRA